MAESITPELELSLLQLMLRFRSIGGDAAMTACEVLRSRLRRVLLTAPSSEDAILEASKLQRRFERKVSMLDGSLDAKRARKKRRQETKKRSAFVDAEAGEGDDDDDDDEGVDEE